MKMPQQIVRQVEIVHASLVGLALLCLVLTGGLLLPVFGLNALSSPLIAGIIIVVVLFGLAYLYFLNFRAHKIVSHQARLTDVLINSLGQGFLTFDAKGVCGSVYSQACHDLLLAKEIEGKSIAAILCVNESEKTVFQEWLDVLFMPAHALSFDDAVRFLPDHFPHPNGNTVVLSYRPVRGKDGSLAQVVLIATDKTEEIEAQKRADNERQFAAMVCAIFAERQAFVLTMSELKELIDRLSHTEKNLQDDLLSANFFRDVHTMKGAAMHFKMEKLGTALHELENTLRQFKDRPDAEIRQQLEQHRAEVQLEYGRIQNAMHDIAGQDEGRPQGLVEVDEDSIYQFCRLLKQQNVSPDILYAYQSNILSVPLFSLLKSLDRQMMPVAEKLEKKVKPIIFRGEHIRVPARPLQRLMMALTHVVHNILDHGIEAPITRMAKGKDPYGEVSIEVTHATDDEGKKWIRIVIADDGAGIDPNKVRSKLMAVDPEGNWRFEDDREIIQQLLIRELSTRDEVSMLSGRGAGMSAVYQEVLALGGRVNLASQVHIGTQLTMLLPEKLEAGSH